MTNKFDNIYNIIIIENIKATGLKSYKYRWCCRRDYFCDYKKEDNF